MNPPSVADVVVGSLAVAIGCAGAVAALTAAVRGGNWLAYVSFAGCLAFIAGVIGQRSYPSGAVLGPWSAGITVPLVGWRITPVALVGLLIAAAGVALLLLFERVQEGPPRPARELRPLDDDDSV